MAEASERGYRWGKFQAWVSLVAGAVIFLTGPFAAGFSDRLARCVIGILFLCVFAGLLHKRRYGFVLVYVIAGAVLLAWFMPLLSGGKVNIEGSVGGLLFWGLPAVLYYPKRYREFGFCKRKEKEKEKVMTATVVETESAVVLNRPSEDAEVQQVLEDMRKRREERKAKGQAQ